VRRPRKRVRPPDPPPPPEAKPLGERIRALRRDKQWNQDDLADASGLDRAYVAGVEAGLRNPTLRNLLRFSRAFGITLSELVDGLK
jgi:transcriptional regulator with XRE-family HTH domain